MSPNRRKPWWVQGSLSSQYLRGSGLCHFLSKKTKRGRKWKLYFCGTVVILFSYLEDYFSCLWQVVLPWSYLVCHTKHGCSQEDLSVLQICCTSVLINDGFLRKRRCKLTACKHVFCMYPLRIKTHTLEQIWFIVIRQMCSKRGEC